MKLIVIPFLLLLFNLANSQTVEVEYDKKRDFTIYKTFSFGESQITTPADQKGVPDTDMNSWIRNAVSSELKRIGLNAVDSIANLVVSYEQGTLGRTDSEQLGPLGLTPGSNPDRNFNYQYRQSSIVIDLADRNGNLIWRINSTTNMTNALTEGIVIGIVKRGFRKFDKLYRKKKK